MLSVYETYEGPLPGSLHEAWEVPLLAPERSNERAHAGATDHVNRNSNLGDGFDHTNMGQTPDK